MDNGNIPDRKHYEEGGWNDGRIGQAYDLIFAAISSIQGGPYATHPLLKAIEALDEEAA